MTQDLQKQPVLSVLELSKRYSRLPGSKEVSEEGIFALDAVSFDLFPGEILGIVGSNGAGKSTLLKVLGQITPPTSGEARYQGRMNAIIEVGTGFHPDLSGRENVFLSGSFNGFSQKELENRYEEIVAFSGLAEFMEMPVKNYSSGMYLRLAFSIAFHVETDILLLDEVLSVGDAAFRKKCATKIKEISSSGTAIIFVSHNANQILEYCHRCFLLEKGRIIQEGLPMEVLEVYSEETERGQEEILHHPKSNEVFKLHQVEIGEPNKGNSFSREEPILISVWIEKFEDQGSMEVMMDLKDLNGIRIQADSHFLQKDYKVEDIPAGVYKITCLIPANVLNRGRYTLGLNLSRNLKAMSELTNVASFKVNLTSGSYQDSVLEIMHCAISLPLEWQIERIKKADNVLDH